MRVVRTVLQQVCVAVAWTKVIQARPGAAAPPERIYIACDDHTDYYWSGDAATYRQAFLDMLDYYLDRVEATAGAPDDYQARFNCDGSLWLWEAEASDPAGIIEYLDHDPGYLVR